MTSKTTPPRTLATAHELLRRTRPRDDASVETWLDYRRRAVELYERIADVDRGHHHEALYWVAREREHVEELTAQFTSGTPG